jgi:deoxyribonuclease-4
MNNELIIGSHVGFANGKQLLGSVEEALSYGSNTFMFYTGAPQNTKRGGISDELTYKAYELMKENDIALENVICHAPYIINLCNEDNFEFSTRFLTEELERVNQLEIKYLVLHPGSHVGLGIEKGIDNIVNGLNIALGNLKDTNHVTILLETMAGKGSEVGSKLEEIKEIMSRVEDQNHIGVCLDTCHLNDAGYDMSKFDEYLDLFEKEIGIDKIGCIHINDSKNEINSHKDRHENIGFGTIGFDALYNVLINKRLENIPKILETPYVDKEYAPYKQEIEMIRSKEFNPNLYNDVIKYYSK